MLGYIISNKSQINIEEHEIKSFDILHKTDLNIFVIENNKILYVNNILFNASSNGNIEILEWFKNSGYEFKYGVMPINYASWNGHIQVLEWFKNYGYKFKYDAWAITWASGYGHIYILKWFKNSGYKFKYNEWAIIDSSRNEDNNILKFYSNNINIKKLIKWSNKIMFIKTIKFKTPQKYLKGYQKN